MHFPDEGKLSSQNAKVVFVLLSSSIERFYVLQLWDQIKEILYNNHETRVKKLLRVDLLRRILPHKLYFIIYYKQKNKHVKSQVTRKIHNSERDKKTKQKHLQWTKTETRTDATLAINWIKGI
jgi:hypothetical protein